MGEAKFLDIEYTEIDNDGFLKFQIQSDKDSNKLGVELAMLYSFYSGTFLTETRKGLENLRTMFDVVRYLRYGHVNDPFYIYFGEFQHVTMGRGLIMSGYSNRDHSNHDRRGLHLNIVCKEKGEKLYGIETVINDFENPTILGGRLFVHPLQSSNIRRLNLNKLEIGMTELIDFDPDHNENPLVAMGCDVGFPLIDAESLRLYPYNDFVLMSAKSGNEFAAGNTLGFGLRISQKAFFKVEGYIFEGGFRPTLFDYNYDMDKMEMYGDRFRGGISGMMALSVIPRMNFFTTLKDYATADPKLYIGIIKSGDWLDYLSFRAFYIKHNMPNISDWAFIENLFRRDNSDLAVRIRLETNLGLETDWKFDFIARYEHRFGDTEEGLEPMNKFSLKIGAIPN